MAYWYFCDHAIWFCKLSNRKDRIEAVERRNVGFSASLAAKCSRPEKMVRHTIARLSPTETVRAGAWLRCGISSGDVSSALSVSPDQAGRHTVPRHRLVGPCGIL
eukprot:scaffold8267_cov37-Tisochrysis_lutea.AAC.2